MSKNQKNLNINISCENIAPLNFSETIKRNNLQIAIFANNGSGKTYLSRMFRFLERDNEPNQEEINRVINIDKPHGNFKFSIFDENNNKENINLSISKDSALKQISTNYIYHVFNQDFVDQNVSMNNYDKDGNIDGDITINIGAENINIKADEKKLLNLINDNDALILSVNNLIENGKKSISSIKNINRLNEFKNITYNNLLDLGKHNCNKLLDDYIKDHDKVKSIPENLPEIQKIDSTLNLINESKEILKLLITEFTLSSFSEEFKNNVHNKQNFIELGIRENTESNCPFCEQSLNNNAKQLIDEYTKFLEDNESKTKNKIQSHIDNLNRLILDKKDIESKIYKSKDKYTDYKNQYIPLVDDLENINEYSDIDTNIKNILIKNLDDKKQDITKPIRVDSTVLNTIDNLVKDFNLQIVAINQKIDTINDKIKKSDAEGKKIRKNICNTLFNKLLNDASNQINEIRLKNIEITNLEETIQKQKQKSKKSKKSEVANTIYLILKHFFGNKYEFDKKEFLIRFNQVVIERGNIKNILSDGEKNIIAFAYYLGDTHQKVKSIEDYSKLFFVIDDPVSSMDFDYTYMLSDLIKDFVLTKDKNKEEKIRRFIILTHNMDFLRIISSNNIVQSPYILDNNKITNFNPSLGTPYISHLIDIYKIANNDKKPKHTTPNSIRHILETINKFESLSERRISLKTFVAEHSKLNSCSYTLINDLSHGSFGSENIPYKNDDIVKSCELVIDIINDKYPKQLEYLKKLI